jgi:hypothetical protein
VKIIWVVLGLAWVTGCSKSSAPAESASSTSVENSVCVEIASICHEHEAYSAKAKDCHEMGHSRESTEQQCQSRRAECLAECNKAAEQPHGESGVHRNTPAKEHEHAPGTDPQHGH